MIQDTTRVNSNYKSVNENIKKEINKQEFNEPLFGNDKEVTVISDEESSILETKKKIDELEQELEELKNNKKERKNFRIFSGSVVTAFVGSAMLGSEKEVYLDDLDDISLKLEKIARTIKSPVKSKLFCIGVFLAKLIAIGVAITTLFVMVGSEHDKDHYKNTEEELVKEQNKLAEQKAQLVELENSAITI